MTHTACIIDDDETFVYVTDHLIRMTNLCENVLIFKNGQVAIEELQGLLQNEESFPEIILLDVNMPILDGWGFLKEFRKIKHQLQREVKIYLATSSIDDRDRIHAKSFPEISGYLVKPLRLETLTELFQDS